jgi:hypothetical protein
MGDAKRRGPYARRKELALATTQPTRMVKAGDILKIGDVLDVQGRRVRVSSFNDRGFRAHILPSQES